MFLQSFKLLNLVCLQELIINIPCSTIRIINMAALGLGVSVANAEMIARAKMRLYDDAVFMNHTEQLHITQKY